MLSTNLHQYPSAFSHVPRNMVEQQHNHLAAQHLGSSSLDTLARSSQYAALQFHQNRHMLSHGKAIVKPHRLPYASGPIAPRNQRDMLHERSGRGSATSGSVRRRISRACDQCNQLRTKCDGRQSCAHCIEFGLTCEYIRERKKRGKASRKDIAQQQAAAAAAGSQPPEDVDTPLSSDQTAECTQSNSPKPPEGQRSLPGTTGRSASLVTPKLELDSTPIYQNRTMSISAIEALPEAEIHRQLDDSMQTLHPMQPPRIQTQGLTIHDPMSEYTSMENYHRSLTYESPLQVIAPGMQPIVTSQDHGLEYADSPYSMLSPRSTHAAPTNPYRLPEEPSSVGYMASTPTIGSPEWMLPSPSTTMYSSAPQQANAQQLRFPVLEPLVPHLSNMMPVNLACDLLELYFDSSSSAFMQPVSPYILGYVFRKQSFLRQCNPRVCSPALLASMIWIGCLTSESPYLSASPSARSQLSEKLINLTIGLLKPLVHQMPGGVEASPPPYGSTNNAYGVTMGGSSMLSQESDISLRAPGGLDDVATYMHLAIVISASEYKAASLRWWNAAWSLARELKFGKEVPVTPPPEQHSSAHEDLDGVPVDGTYRSGPTTPIDFTEEQREERRRIWWLLYTVDR
ncbi:hypothetical protein NX059_000607 [Plenodomus lindquistii]|nr:hypothetical protein NX059_000607 [Plenodomus lindquistii]